MSKALLPGLYAIIQAMVLFSYLHYYLAILLDGTSGHKALLCYVCVVRISLLMHVNATKLVSRLTNFHWLILLFYLHDHRLTGDGCLELV